MNISRPLIYERNSRRSKLRENIASSFFWLIFLAFCLPASSGVLDRNSDARAELPPFLEVFKGKKQPPIVAKKVSFPSAIGPVKGYVARPKTDEHLPAILLIPDRDGLTDWMKTNTRDLASVGYVVLAVDVKPRRLPSVEIGKEQTLAELSAGVRWLRRRADVLPAQLGVLGFGWGGTQALLLASAAPVQACVVCEGTVTSEPAVVAGLHGTPVFGIFAEKDAGAQKTLPAFRRALTQAQIVNKFHIVDGTLPGFMGPPRRKEYAHLAADEAWVQIYEFLGKYVEDAPWNHPVVGIAKSQQAAKPVASIADIMHAVNNATGVRGTLIKALEEKPATALQWKHARANAALVAEAAHLLKRQTPAKGPRRDWLAQAQAFSADAQAIVTAADQRDYAAARASLQKLATHCQSCHAKHR